MIKNPNKIKPNKILEQKGHKPKPNYRKMTMEKIIGFFIENI